MQIFPSFEAVGTHVRAPAQVFQRLLDVSATDPERLVSDAQVIRTLPVRLVVQTDVWGNTTQAAPAQPAHDRAQRRTPAVARHRRPRRLLPGIAAVKLVGGVW